MADKRRAAEGPRIGETEIRHKEVCSVGRLGAINPLPRLRSCGRRALAASIAS